MTARAPAGAAHDGSNRQHSDQLRTVLLKWRAWILLASYTIVAMAAAYIAEVVIIDGWATWQDWWRLALVGALALVVQVWAWRLGYHESARRGAVVHLGLPRPGETSDHSRWLTSHAILQTWVDTLWPSRLVMAPRFAEPYASEVGRDPSPDSERPVRGFAVRAAEALNAARVIAPGASTVCVFPEGAWMPTLGYLLADSLGERVHLMADVSDSSNDAPFLEFDLPRRPEGEAAPSEPAGRAPGIALHVGRGSIPEGFAFVELSPDGSGAIAENPGAYQQTVERIRAELVRARASRAGLVTVNYKGPASIGFALGIMARWEGLRLVDVDRDGRRITSAESLPATSVVATGLRRSWAGHVWGTSALLGAFSVGASSAAALLLEWWPGRSQADPNWLWCGIIAVLAAALGLAGWRVSRPLDDPQFTLDLGPHDGAGTLGARRIHPVAAPRDAAGWSLDRLAEISAAFPDGRAIRLGGLDLDDKGWEDYGRRVTQGFRGTHSPLLHSGGQQVPLEPRTCSEANRYAGGLHDPRLRAAALGTTRMHDVSECDTCGPSGTR